MESKRSRIDESIPTVIVRFVMPDGPTVEAEVLETHKEEVEVRVIRPWYGVVMRVPKEYLEKREEPKEATLRLFRARGGDAVAIYTTEDKYDNLPLRVKGAGREGLEPDALESIYMSIQGYINPALEWKDVDSASYHITNLYCAAEHIGFLCDEKVNLEHVRELDLVMQGDDYPTRNNVHLVPDYDWWNQVFGEKMRKLNTVRFHFRGNLIIPRIVWSWIFDRRFTCATMLHFERCGNAFNDDTIRKIQDASPLARIGNRDETWCAPMIMTYLMNEKLRKGSGLKRINPHVFKLFASPCALVEPGAVFPSDLCLLGNFENEADPVDAMFDEFYPKWKHLYTNLFLPLSKQEAIKERMTFEDAVCALSLGEFLGAKPDILSYIIHVWCMRLYKENVDLLLEDDFYDPSDVREFFDSVAKLVS